MGVFELKSSSPAIAAAYDPRRMTDVGYSYERQRILPGETQTIEVMHPLSPAGEGRYVCVLARDTIRTRIYDWQWASNGPGPKANWLIPKFLKGKMMDVKAESEWLKADSPLK